MLSTETLGLVERLQRCSELWTAASGGSLAQLGRVAVNDSTFFSRLESPRGPTTATLEKFARFLTDPANWPEGVEVPGEVLAFGHVTGISPASTTPSRGNSGESFPLELAPIEIPALLGKREVAA